MKNPVTAGNEFSLAHRSLGEGGNEESQIKPKQERKINNMKTKIISRTILSFGLAFVLVSAITQVRGDGVVAIHSTGDVTRGQTGSFVLNMSSPPNFWGGVPVHFSVDGTAIPGVDYIPLVSPALVQIIPPPPPCQWCRSTGLGVILVKTLPDLRGPILPQAYSVVVTLEPGFGYAVGEPSSAQIMIKP